jgi:hypothetical protein
MIDLQAWLETLTNDNDIILCFDANEDITNKQGRYVPLVYSLDQNKTQRS